MNNDYLNKFYELGYTHEELEALLKKISNGELLTKDQYDAILSAIDIVTNLTTFDGTYDSLKNVPDIVDTVKQSNEFISFQALDARAKTIQVSLEKTLLDFLADKLKMFDLDHKHDDRYSLKTHDHAGLYLTQNDMGRFVTVEYINSIMKQLESGISFPTYVTPTLTLEPSTSSVSHKEPTVVVVSPTYTQNDAGDIVKFSILRNGELVYEGVEIKGFTEELVLAHGETVTYSFAVQYEDGPIKSTSDGREFPDTMIKAGTIVSGTTIKCIANSYYGTVDEGAPLDIVNFISVKNNSRVCTCDYNMNNQKSVYMYPASFGLLDSIKDGNGFEYINSYSQSTLDYDDIIYNVYTLIDAVTVDGIFRQTFK